MLPALHYDVIVLTGYTGQDLSAHLAGANGETAHRFGTWPKTTAPATAPDAFAHWAHEWETGGSTRAFAARDQVSGRLLGGCELRIQPRGSAHVRYWTAAADRGCGYATRSLVLLLRYARTIGIRQATAHIARTITHPGGWRRKLGSASHRLHRGRRQLHDPVPGRPDTLVLTGTGHVAPGCGTRIPDQPDVAASGPVTHDQARAVAASTAVAASPPPRASTSPGPDERPVASPTKETGAHHVPRRMPGS